MRFKKSVSAELRKLLKEQLKQYKKEMDMTSEELHDLEEWVSAGNSPYDNGDYVCYEGGYPVDYITAKRTLQEEFEWFNSLSDEEREEYHHGISLQYNTETEELYRNISDLGMLFAPDPDEELPFS